TVAEEAPHLGPRRVGDAPVLQVAVEARLVDGVEGPQAHRDGWELPEVRHQARVRVAGEPGTARLPAEAVEVLLAEPALEERPGIDPGGGVALEEDLVARPAAVLPPEEVVEARLVHRSRRGVGRQV